MGISWNIVSRLRRILGIHTADHISVRPPMGLGMSIGVRHHTGIAMQNCRTIIPEIWDRRVQGKITVVNAGWTFLNKNPGVGRARPVHI